MTLAQWMFEYEALQAKERDEVEVRVAVETRVLRAQRDMFITLLGLNLLPEREEEKAKAGDDYVPDILPLSVLVGRPQMIRDLLDGLERAQSETAAAQDANFEAFSANLLKQLKEGKSDLPDGMVPLLTGDLSNLERNAYWHSDAAQAAMVALGIKERTATTAVPHVGKRLKPGDEQQDLSFMSEEEMKRIYEEQAEMRAELLKQRGGQWRPDRG